MKWDQSKYKGIVETSDGVIMQLRQYSVDGGVVLRVRQMEGEVCEFMGGFGVLRGGCGCGGGGLG